MWGLDWSWQRFTKGHVKICQNVFVTKKLEIGTFLEKLSIAREYCLFKCNKYRDIVEELYAVTLLYVLSFLIRYGGCFPWMFFNRGWSPKSRLFDDLWCASPIQRKCFFLGLSNEGNHITVYHCTIYYVSFRLYPQYFSRYLLCMCTMYIFTYMYVISTVIYLQCLCHRGSQSF